jgi:hypothetical protein
MRLLAASLVLALLAAAGPASAQQYYKWKDANGVTHYTKTPPPEGTQSDRVAVQAAPTGAGTPPADAAAAGTAGAGATTVTAACEQARSNVNVLETNTFVTMDKNGDGKPERLTAEEQAAQLALARDQVRLLCPATTAPAG